MSRYCYSAEEKQFIIDQVEEHKLILENPKNDLKNNMAKRKVWSEIMVKFNSAYSKNQSEKSIINIYRKMKSNARKEVSAVRKEQRSTGGGPSTATISDTSEQLLELDDDISFSIDNKYDDDAVPDEIGVSVSTSSQSNARTSTSIGRNNKVKSKHDMIQTEHEKRLEVLDLQKKYEKQLEVEEERRKYYAALNQSLNSSSMD